ncbi:MAG: CPBP family intramembrane glutamic endopeptidase [Wenzhouxiangella sp.]
MALGVVLALIFDLHPWRGTPLNAGVVAWSLIWTVPLVALLLTMPLLRHWSWLRETMEFVEQVLVPLFRGAPLGAIVLVSVLAGIGEELLFRGVIQDGLALWFGPVPAIVAASLLFGLAHAITPAYFVIATVMGAYLGAIYHLSDNLLIPVIVHALYDWIAIHFYIRRARRLAAPAD